MTKFKTGFLFLFISLFFLGNIFSVKAQQSDNVSKKTEIIVFERDGCRNCKNELEFLKNNEVIRDNYKVQLLDIKEKDSKEKFNKIIEFYGLAKVTPITLVGGEVLVGFSEETTGEKILSHSNDKKEYTIEYYLKKNNSKANTDSSNSTCSVEDASSCSITSQKDDNESKSEFDLPYFGKVDVKETSLFVLSFVLGFIDGFNPCAMWVLLTFLIILSQTGSKKKMIYVAGLFILAEAIMYFFILNVWYKTWDFINLDSIVTPLIGIVAVGGGLYFLYKYSKSKGELTCDVTSLEYQQKTTKKIKDAISKPITIVTSLVVIGIAFSVNIIEFACSVGIAQSFTKILEINQLNFISQQWYTFVYTFAYMIDDFIIFTLAILGFQKFQAVGQKYSHLSTLLGGILLILMGAVLIFAPNLLIF